MSDFLRIRLSLLSRLGFQTDDNLILLPSPTTSLIIQAGEILQRLHNGDKKQLIQFIRVFIYDGETQPLGQIR